MCGRFSLIHNLEELVERFRIQRLKLSWLPRYNIAPGQDVAVVFEDGGEIVGDSFSWGLIPSWSKSGERGKLINARGESVDVKPSFRASFVSKRCLVLADGFFEWAKAGSAKQPFYFKLKDGEAFGFAGLYETWDGWDETVNSCTIITTEPNKIVKPVHDRMPVMLGKSDEDVWLSPDSEADDLKALLRLYPPEDMEAYPVSREVNNPENKGEQIIERLAVKGDEESQKHLTDYLK